MKVFRVLWFEDNHQNFSEIVNSLTGYLAKFYERELHFELHDHYPADFDVKMFEGFYDVAFIDLNLNNGQSGVEIIDILREKGAFMEILLYSNNPVELERFTEGINFVEGIYRHATMTGIEEKMKDVIAQVCYKEIMILKRNGYSS